MLGSGGGCRSFYLFCMGGLGSPYSGGILLACNFGGGVYNRCPGEDRKFVWKIFRTCVLFVGRAANRSTIFLSIVVSLMVCGAVFLQKVVSIGASQGRWWVCLRLGGWFHFFGRGAILWRVLPRGFILYSPSPQICNSQIFVMKKQPTTVHEQLTYLLHGAVTNSSSYPWRSSPQLPFLGADVYIEWWHEPLISRTKTPKAKEKAFTRTWSKTSYWLMCSGTKLESIF